ncbi:L-threonylcarbamoyladenylate synthase [Halorientalis pallida]|uniref:L-threonylcarbamoyladenylate synthase n=1 Tax=Halorientalis pallida TaxID=2479928 RepID=A0A498KXX8_9EURY|nr:L-threonylcarbamoyladenylate synthase [Halorientalis pallida]RXK50460.1 threonylcarbamoyl-AMP synthase [Halorientalis pallida]
MTDGDIERAADALRDGELVVYPTETVYGLGADATDGDTVERVFEAKGRDRDKPVSLAVPDIETALEYTAPTADERAFMHEFLPGAVTVLVDRRDVVPDVLTSGGEKVGVRVPDHELALELLDAFHPITATSANVSGTGSVRELDELGEQIREAVAVLLDGGRTPGGGSTVVDVDAGEIHRRGPLADEIEGWL